MFEGIPTNAKDASGLGLLYYQSTTPCKRGHTSLRRVRNGVCMDCESLRKKERRKKERKPSAKKLAVEIGENSYHGQRCAICDNKEKYTNSSQCVRCSNHHMNHDEVKLLIVRFPHKHVTWYASKARRKVSAIYDAYQALNIPRRGKPRHYIG